MDNVMPINKARPHAPEFFVGIGLAKTSLGQAGFSVSWAKYYEASSKSADVAERVERAG